MINVSKFFKPDATEQWFNVPAVNYGWLSVHEMLRERGYNIIDRNTLQSKYADLHAPINMVDLSYAPSIAVPAPCLLYTSPSPRDLSTSRMPSSA